MIVSILETKIKKIKTLVGCQYVVNPINKQKKKHRGRLVNLIFIETDRGVVSAKVKYLDTNRIGKLDLRDLDKVIQ